MKEHFGFTTLANKTDIRNALSVDTSLHYLDLLLTDAREMRILLFITGRLDRERRPDLWAILGYGVIGLTGEPKPYVGHLRLPEEGLAHGRLWESSRKELARIAKYFGVTLDSELVLKARIVAKTSSAPKPYLTAEPQIRAYGRRKGWTGSRLTAVLNALESYHEEALENGRKPGFEVQRRGPVLWLDVLGLVIYLEQGGSIRWVGSRATKLFRGLLANQTRRTRRS
jgi:hypothetical protein